MADLAVLEGTGADPHALLRCGQARLGRLIGTASHGQQGTQRAAQWLAAARASLQLYDDHPAVAFTDLAAEVQTEVRLLRATQAELERHAAQREYCYRRAWPAQAGPLPARPGPDRWARPDRHHGPRPPVPLKGTESSGSGSCSKFVFMDQPAQHIPPLDTQAIGWLAGRI